MKFSKENIIDYLIIILLFLQPILDIFYFNNNNFEIFGFQLSTLIRLGIFALISILFFLNFKNLKFKKIFFGYMILNILYFGLHYWNALNFYSYVPGNLNFSVFEELFYYLRMLIPMFLLYYTFNSSITDLKFNKSVYITLGIIIFTIFVSNIFKFSLCSYSDNLISGNIFDWFINPGKFGYLVLASRGIFTNIIVFYLVLLFLPYIIYLMFKSEGYKKYINYIFIIISMLSSFMAGTKATTLGFIIIAIVSLLLSLFFSIIKKEQKFLLSKNLFLVIIILISFFMIDYSPMVNRTATDEKIESNKQEQEINKEISIPTVEKEEIIKYLAPEEKQTIIDKEDKLNVDEVLELVEDEIVKKMMLVEILSKNYYYYGFNLKFIEQSYSYEYDPIFWKNLVDSTYYYERSNNRMVVEKIFDRIFEVNDNDFDKYFGITYSRTSKVFNLERDFLYQYYSMGLLGCILLLGPYILVVLISGIFMLIKFKEKLTFKNCSLLLGIGLTLCLAFYSGNTIENLTITMPLGIMCGYLLKNLLAKD